MATNPAAFPCTPPGLQPPEPVASAAPLTPSGIFPDPVACSLPSPVAPPFIDTGLIISVSASASGGLLGGGGEIDFVYDLYGFGYGIYSGPGTGLNRDTGQGYSLKASYGVIWGWSNFYPPTVDSFRGLSYTLSGSLPIRPPLSIGMGYGTNADITTSKPLFSLQSVALSVGIDLSPDMTLAQQLAKPASFNPRNIIDSGTVGYAEKIWSHDFRSGMNRSPTAADGHMFKAIVLSGLPATLKGWATHVVDNNIRFWQYRNG